jgi:fucose permease
MSAFWLAFLGSRLAVAMLLLQFHWGQALAASLPLLLAIFTAMVVSNLAGGTPRPLGAAQGLVCLGLVLGPIVPTLLAVGLQRESHYHGQHFSHPEPGTAFGALFAIGSLGSLFLAPLIGASARDGSVQKTFRLLSPLVLLLLIATLAIWLR